jgi:hypothetical protein
VKQNYNLNFILFFSHFYIIFLFNSFISYYLLTFHQFHFHLNISFSFFFGCVLFWFFRGGLTLEECCCGGGKFLIIKSVKINYCNLIMRKLGHLISELSKLILLFYPKILNLSVTK